MRHSKQLVEQILEVAKSRGLRANAVAARAGISKTNLSRIRRTGKYNADTLERLLSAADVTFEVKPRAIEKETLSLVVKKLNAGRPEKLTEGEFEHLLLRFYPSKAAERAFSHLVGLIEEIPLDQVNNLVREGSAALPSLQRICDYVGGRGETAEWLNDRAA